MVRVVASTAVAFHGSKGNLAIATESSLQMLRTDETSPTWQGIAQFHDQLDAQQVGRAEAE